MAALNHTEQFVDAAGTTVEVRRGGQGRPLLIVHGEFGVPGWINFYQRLGDTHEVIVPSLPGYGKTTRTDWIMGARDLAVWITWLARDLKIQTPLDLIGFSMGGWVAAEIATIAPQFINRMVLVGAAGIKPDKGEIFDYFLESGRTGMRRAFHRPEQSQEYMQYFGKEWSPEESDFVEQHREMTCRVAWKPYMHSLTLRGLLPSVRVPTLLVWGREDAIVPLNSGEIYQDGIPKSNLSIIEDCGHMPEMEKPSELTKMVGKFLR
jgi:pimeloyl-ACP methyl ester carboxylesterase